MTKQKRPIWETVYPFNLSIMKYCHQCRKNTNTITVYDDSNDEQYDDCCPTCGADLTYSEFKPLETKPVVTSLPTERKFLTEEEYYKKIDERQAKEDAWIEGMIAKMEQNVIIIEPITNGKQ